MESRLLIVERRRNETERIGVDALADFEQGREVADGLRIDLAAQLWVGADQLLLGAAVRDHVAHPGRQT